MSETTNKSAYCPNCTKNVPHRREIKGAISGVIDSFVGGALEAMRIGPWYCLHCDRRKLLLQSPRKEAQDYRLVDPLDPISPDAVNMWSPAVANGEVGNVTLETHKTPPATSSSSGKIHRVSNSKSRPEAEKSCDSISIPAVKTDEFCDSFDEDLACKPSEWMSESEEVDRDRESIDHFNDFKIPNGKPLESDPEKTSIANSPERFMQSTRMHRVSEKYRDSIVDRIMAGKVSISELDQMDEFSEAELVCWIADKFKRMKQQLEELESKSSGRLNERGPATGGYGPFGAR